jgi:hypothetical protein
MKVRLEHGGEFVVRGTKFGIRLLTRAKARRDAGSAADLQPSEALLLAQQLIAAARRVQAISDWLGREAERDVAVLRAKLREARGTRSRRRLRVA